ncbi:unnamed protein product [Larinioides sclopetarius]|uniref:Uncharacterized protein n=1 Tax=Larinioides sclopetarius TaxID=280406 RepID=A0AAV2A1Y7_9ARAC
MEELGSLADSEVSLLSERSGKVSVIVPADLLYQQNEIHQNPKKSSGSINEVTATNEHPNHVYVLKKKPDI